MAFDYNKLIGRIIEKCKTRQEFAKRMGLSERTVSLKLQGKIAWKQTEILKALEILDLTVNDVQEYFFNLIVQ